VAEDPCELKINAPNAFLERVERICDSDARANELCQKELPTFRTVLTELRACAEKAKNDCLGGLSRQIGSLNPQVAQRWSKDSQEALDSAFKVVACLAIKDKG
jgi:hypothetical protein